jgi:hypothetical protein
LGGESRRPKRGRDGQCHADRKGENRPVDVIGNAVKVMRIATGDETERLPDPGKDSARKGGCREANIMKPRVIKGITKVQYQKPPPSTDTEPDEAKNSRSTSNMEPGYYWVRFPNSEWQVASYNGLVWALCGDDSRFEEQDDENQEADMLEVGNRLMPPE